MTTQRAAAKLSGFIVFELVEWGSCKWAYIGISRPHVHVPFVILIVLSDVRCKLFEWFAVTVMQVCAYIFPQKKPAEIARKEVLKWYGNKRRTPALIVTMKHSRVRPVRRSQYNTRFLSSLVVNIALTNDSDWLEIEQKNGGTINPRKEWQDQK